MGNARASLPERPPISVASLQSSSERGVQAATAEEVAHLIERAGLNAVILHEKPNAGRTIIEKFEKHGGSAGFAVVLLTPNDVGGPNREQPRPRARQNVIGEMFW